MEIMNNHSPKRQSLAAMLSLALYDALLFMIIALLLLGVYQGGGRLTAAGALMQCLLAALSLFSVRYICRIYRQVWRYGGIQCYILLLAADSMACVLYMLVEAMLPIQHIAKSRLLAVCCINTLGSLAIRMIYRYAYKYGSLDNRKGKVLRWMLRFFSGNRVGTEVESLGDKTRIAIIGAGSVGISLAEDLRSNPKAAYVPVAFIDNDPQKIGREIHNLMVYPEKDTTLIDLKKRLIDEVVFAAPNMERTRKLELFDYYQNAGFRIKVFDFPAMDMPQRRRELRDFRVEDLLMRSQQQIINDKTKAYYQDKVILITGGGGSIGSEICRQLCRMGPKQVVLVDIYENCAYDLQQGMLYAYKKQIDVCVEIVSITNKRGLERVFEEYHPDICINAAAHKHVPLMEKNCVEAVENNVFGTLNVIRCCEAYGCGRFMMVSTDKAVNPTNVMGATKRMCEIIMQAYSTNGKVKCSATRFGNVLGSAGSVIPLFKRQIQAGGPVTLTDYRIIRYFMTIPEASQLVLTSGAMAENGDLFVLDMGQPVRILDLAKNMIRLSGVEGIEIIETGLRPGEKLYEELLVKNDTLEKTENDLIFIEHEVPVTMDELNEKLDLLHKACETGNDDVVRKAMHQVVPTFRTPEEVNLTAEQKIREQRKD